MKLSFSQRFHTLASQNKHSHVSFTLQLHESVAAAMECWLTLFCFTHCTCLSSHKRTDMKCGQSVSWKSRNFACFSLCDVSQLPCLESPKNSGLVKHSHVDMPSSQRKNYDRTTLAWSNLDAVLHASACTQWRNVFFPRKKKHRARQLMPNTLVFNPSSPLTLHSLRVSLRIKNPTALL